MDPQLATAETRKIQHELADAAAIISGWKQSNGHAAPLTEDQVRGVLTSAEGLTDLLKAADRTERAALYRNLGVQLRYMKEAPTGLERIQAQLELRSSGGRI